MDKTVRYSDLEYASGLLLDLTLPAEAEHPLPLLVWMHGGAWRLGDRHLVVDRQEWLAARGFAIASIDYRLSGDAAFPAPLDDVLRALRWLRAHANDYGLDPHAVGLWGSSAGGHLAALAALTARGDDRVQAVVNGYGAADLLAPDQSNPPTEGLLGGPIAARRERAIQASPAHQVGDTAPPFLLLHGAADPLMPPSQSIALYDALVARGHDATLYLIEGFGHGFLNAPDDSELGPAVPLDSGRLAAEPHAPAEIRSHRAAWVDPALGLPASASFELIASFFERTLTR